jgi:hypothetical protein
MKINCLHCGHAFGVDDSYCDYEGLLKCPTCAGLLEARIQDGMIRSVRPGSFAPPPPAPSPAPVTEVQAQTPASVQASRSPSLSPSPSVPTARRRPRPRTAPRPPDRTDTDP